MSKPTSSILLIRRLRLTKICRERSISRPSLGVANKRDSSRSASTRWARSSAAKAEGRSTPRGSVWGEVEEPEAAGVDPPERAIERTGASFITPPFGFLQKGGALLALAFQGCTFLRVLLLAWQS